MATDGIVGNATWEKLFPASSTSTSSDSSSTGLLQALKGHIPNEVIAQIPAIAELTNALRLAHFLAQCAHESGGFKVVYENLNY